MSRGGGLTRIIALGCMACLLGVLPRCGPFESGAVAQSEFRPFAGETGAHAGKATVEGYMHDNPHAKLIGSSAFAIDGNKVYCGKRPVILDSKFDSWGGAFPGFLIWNDAWTAKLPTVVKLYIFSHECGHQFVGRDEKAADCFAMRRARRYGWLDETGMNQICDFIGHLRADDEHAGGNERCAYMRQCFAAAAPKN